MLEWIKNKLGVTALEHENSVLKAALDNHRAFVSSEVERLKDFTRVDADVGFRGGSTIILTGVYKRKAYVKFYDVQQREFEHFVRQVQDMKRYALLRNIDAPPEFHGTFDL